VVWNRHEAMVTIGWIDTLKTFAVVVENLKKSGVEVEIATVDINTFYDYNYKMEDDFFHLSWTEFDALVQELCVSSRMQTSEMP
jgi:ABC-type proline/glycine betaine transport system substrate-binding protein